MTTSTEDPSHISQLMKKHGALFSKHFSSTLDEQTAVLKAHLLIENIIRDFCYSSVRHPEHLRTSRLSFHQIVGLARSLMFLDSPAIDTFWGMVNQLNLLRNLMAHELEPNEDKIEACKKALMSAAKLSSLNGSLSYLCGVMHSLLPVSLELHHNPQALDDPGSEEESK